MTTEDTTSNKRPASALQMGPCKKVSTSDPLISHGHHFSRTVFALCNFPSLLTNGILRLEQMEDSTLLEDFSAEEWREHCMFKHLLESYPGLLEQLQKGYEEELIHVGELIGKGAAGARGDNTKTLKSAVIDWISPKGAAIQPHLHRNLKIDCGFNHELTGSLLCPAGLDWKDPEMRENLQSGEILAYKHVFIFLSSVDKEPKATQSGNACLHSMNAVMITSIAYIAMQVRFTLSSLSVFSQTDTTTDSETFYHSLLDLLEDPDESKENEELLTW
ncbi:hypothetical protein EDD22DRAFT_956795 [Suillus occidentalis]|nr:hypothetical protein EDD22DRAFT_956795 [Suillus occidentalis]